MSLLRLFLFASLSLSAGPVLSLDEPWLEEARAETGVPDPVLDATLDYAEDGDFEATQVIFEGTVERFPYGHRQATLICAPLRICSIVLEDGEIVLDVLSGDTQHWQTFELTTGPGGSTPVVGVRPMVDFEFAETCDKSTNLVITTDRRVYDIQLELPPCSQSEASDPNPHRPYHRRLSFYYPDDLLESWHTRAQLRALQEQLLAESQASAPPTLLAPASGVESLNWDYRVRSGAGNLFAPRFPWRPQAIFDDGERTYIRLPPEARDLPAVFEVTGGEDAVVNFTPAADDPSLLILPRVAEHLVLVLPRGKRRARLDLINEALR